MSEFEIITLTYSFVLGLGIAQILSAASAGVPAIVASQCLFAIGGLFLVRRRVLPRLQILVQDCSEFSGAPAGGRQGQQSQRQAVT